ncbi:MAG: hypothetical protein H7X93_01795 [Sphingomonadaceae bacterium]|nr:hypothetical protein [Sphingomonadaceae bacterium]
MRNMLIIAGALLVLAAGALILFGGEWFKEDIAEPSREAPAPREGEEDAPPPNAEEEVGNTVAPSASRLDEASVAPRPTLADQLADGARQINAGGPIRLDEMTMMTSASSAGSRITYRVEFSRRLTPRQAASLRELAASSNRSALCAREVTREWIAMGAEVEYAYFDPTGRRLFSTPVTSC